VLADGVPLARNEFSVRPDGRRLYFASGRAFYVFNEEGDLVSEVPVDNGFARSIVALKNGDLLAAQSHAVGQIARLSHDGASLKRIVGRGPTPTNLRQDGTAWTSPTGVAVDETHGLIFALDTTSAPNGQADPDWSRVAVFDMNGGYQRSIAAYDSSHSVASDPLRTWYDDIEVDPQRARVYVTARAARELWAFDYAGRLLGKVPGVSGIAVFPEGRLAVVDPDHRHIRVYTPSLELSKMLDAPSALDLETDASSHLYASTTDPSVLLLRWSRELVSPEIVRPRSTWISVDFPADTAISGQPFSVGLGARGRPEPARKEWHAFARPSDGSSLVWHELDTKRTGEALTIFPPRELSGFYDIAVRLGAGSMGDRDFASDLHVRQTMLFRGADEHGRIALRSLTGRAGFRRGEAIAFRIELSGATSSAGTDVTLTLRRDGLPLARARVPAAEKYWQLPPEITRRLLPGRYSIEAEPGALASDPLEFELAESEPSSPLQRIIYHEFEQQMRGTPRREVADTASRLEYVRAYVDAVAALGFTRETDRSGLGWLGAQDVGTWRDVSLPGSARHDRLPTGGNWEPGAYLDLATARGISYDTQIFVHCASMPVAPNRLVPLDAGLERLAQWLGRYPSFYGFNYNDELFPSTNADDRVWLAELAVKKPERSPTDRSLVALGRMYQELNHSVERVRPDLARTATPMWQFPAVEGSYAPTIYEHLTESYSHYLSEGYGWPFYPAHSAEMLRRPGLPLMAVFDDGYSAGNGEFYLKDALQVLGRGAQGIGVEHVVPLLEAPGADALRTMNRLAEEYGPLFAGTPPKNEAAILYSYSQDVTEKRDLLGTPHWERVLALHGALLMAGLPANIIYEEDVARGALLDAGKPKQRFLFLAGQTTALPDAVRTAVRAFQRAGGRVVVDDASGAIDSDERFSADLMAPMNGARSAFDTDGLFPLAQPEYERIAAALRTAFGSTREFMVDTDDPWISKNQFDGGAIRYVLLAQESRPYPWPAGETWSLGARYAKSAWPERARVSLPAAPVIYDVFDRHVAARSPAARATLEADLRTFPGRLYALAQAELEPPQVTARVESETVEVGVNVGLPARVPLRVSLSNGSTESTSFRGTDAHGQLSLASPVPLGAGPFRIEVSELLGGKSSALELTAPPSGCGPRELRLVEALPSVDVERAEQISSILEQSRTVHLLKPRPDRELPLEGALLAALKRKGLTVVRDPTDTPVFSPRIVISEKTDDDTPSFVHSANRAGLFEHTLSRAYPGAGRGFISAVFATPTYGNDSVVLVGGDSRGLELAVTRFIALLEARSKPPKALEKPCASPPLSATSAKTANLVTPILSERVGARLSRIRANHGKLVVSADGFIGNLARVDDAGDHAQILAVARAGQSPSTTSLFLSADGSKFGLAARTVERFGEAFFMASVRSDQRDAFTSFGNEPPFQHQFAASSDANTVLAPGPYGVVAWHRAAGTWREAWAVDYWRQFDHLDWSTAIDSTRIPGFDTRIPERGNEALIVFTEFTNHPSLSSRVPSKLELSARSLANGAPRWSFTPPLRGNIVPRLFSGESGALVVLQARLGSAGVVRYFVLANGHSAGAWSSQDDAQALAVSESNGRIAVAYGGGSRILELRRADGSLIFSKVWHSQPLAIALTADGAALFVSDDAGELSRIDANGDILWQRSLDSSAALAWDDQTLYVASWNGRVRALNASGHERWVIDLTPRLAELSAAGAPPPTAVHEAVRASTASSAVVPGPNLLRSAGATVSVGGTPGWKSQGSVAISASMLTNGRDDDEAAWIPAGELYSDGVGNRKVWIEMNFARPTRIHSVTVRENPVHPESWPTGSLLQIWDDLEQRWKTAQRGLFLRGPRNTYRLEATIRRLRYVPWGNYFENFHTSEIEVR